MNYTVRAFVGCVKRAVSLCQIPDGDISDPADGKSKLEPNSSLEPSTSPLNLSMPSQLVVPFGFGVGDFLDVAENAIGVYHQGTCGP